MTIQMRALFVHLFTATGAVLAMLAMLAAVEEKWDLMFLWLVIAFFVDGIDGPLARKYDVKTNAPEFDGVLMDLIIDYLTYVFIPAFALFTSGLMDGWGIHWNPKHGWIYNIWGYDCVKIMRGEKAVRIGTNDLPGLLALLTEKATESGTVDSP